MSIFVESYASIYDLLYQNKNYACESNYVLDLVHQYSPHKVSKVLELGCGTGGHVAHWCDKLDSYLGIDLSESMLEKAKNKNLGSKVQWVNANIQDFNCNAHFDLVVSLFHVSSYQTTNIDLKKYFETASRHLESEGIFVFDFWYGPAVLLERPVQKKIYKAIDAFTRIERTTTPSLRLNQNNVDIEIEIKLLNEPHQPMKSFKEIHHMRYLFLPEIKKYAEDSGLIFLDSFEWLTNSPLSDKTWLGVAIFKK